MVAITPKTELAAVNLILRNMGETPVNSLSGVLPLEASQAYGTLNEVSEEVQTKGWFFNREHHRLLPDANGTIKLPPNTLSIRAVGQSRQMQLINRGNKLYDKSPFKNTFTFKGPVEIEIVLGLSFDELPASARLYIALKAARVMQVREAGDEMSYQEDNVDEARALAELHAEQLAAEPLSLKDNSTVHAVISGMPIGGLW